MNAEASPSWFLLLFCSFWTKRKHFTSEAEEEIVWLVCLGGFLGFCVYLLKKKKFKHFWNFKVWWQFVWGFFVYLFLLLCFWLALLLFSEGNILLLSLFVKASLIWASSRVKSFSFSLWSKRSIVIIFNFVTKQRYSYGYNLCAVFGWCFSQHWDSEF